MPGHVLDACFVEDLQAAGLLAASCTNLEWPMVGGFAASADTELALRMADLARCGVRVRHLRTLEIVQHQSLQANHPALSVADVEALVIARADNAVLLTGDGSLRKAALDAGGSPWSCAGRGGGGWQSSCRDPTRPLRDRPVVGACRTDGDNSLDKPSAADAFQICSVSQTRFVSRVGMGAAPSRSAFEVALRRQWSQTQDAGKGDVDVTPGAFHELVGAVVR